MEDKRIPIRRTSHLQKFHKSWAHLSFDHFSRDAFTQLGVKISRILVRNEERKTTSQKWSATMYLTRQDLSC
eukprot:715650-Hanusia_phi.AAC.2